jgi:hypothetical protein
MLGWLVWRWLWGIYSPQPPIQPLGRAAVDGRTGQCPVRQPRHPTVRVLTVSTVVALSSCGTGQSGAAPDSPVPHRTDTVHCLVHFLWLL